MVECNLAKVDVAGSNPVSRSIADPFGLDSNPRSLCSVGGDRCKEKARP